MSVMKRKLFNREARDELRRMGGIMASSEPLMMAAQGYAPGGMVEPQQVFAPRSGLGSNRKYTYLDFLEEYGLNDSPQAREMFVKYQQHLESQVASGPLVNPASENKFLDQPLEMSEPPMAMDAPSSLPAGTTRPSTPGPARGSGLEALRKDSPYPSSAVMASVPVTPAEELISSASDPAVLAAAQSYGARPSEENALSEMSDTRLEAEARAREKVLPELGMDILEGTTGAIRGTGSYLTEKLGEGASSIGLPGVGAALVEQSQRIDEISEQRAAEEAAREAETQASVDEVLAEQARRSASGPSTRGGPAVLKNAEAAGEVEEVVEEAAAPVFPPLGQFIDLPGDRGKREKIQEKADEVLPEIDKDIKDADTEEKFDSVFDKYVKKFTEILGEDEDKAAKDKAFAMAMFGATYASTGDFGQASAVMIDMLRGDNATRQERKDKIKMLALQAGLDIKKEERALAALIRKEDRALTNAIKLAAAKAYIEGQDDPKKAVENIVKVVNTFAGTGAGIEKAIEIATRNSNIPEEIMKEVYKQFGITFPSGAQKTPTGGAQSLADIK